MSCMRQLGDIEIMNYNWLQKYMKGVWMDLKENGKKTDGANTSWIRPWQRLKFKVQNASRGCGENLIWTDWKQSVNTCYCEIVNEVGIN